MAAYLSHALLLASIYVASVAEDSCSRAWIVGELPSPEEESHVAAPEVLDKFRNFLKSKAAGSVWPPEKQPLGGCSAKALGHFSRRLQATTTPAPEAQIADTRPTEPGTPHQVTSLSFMYRRGAIVEAFAGMGVSGPTVDGRDPNLTFFNAPVAIGSSLQNPSLLLADEGTSKVVLLRKLPENQHVKTGHLVQDWNVSTVVDGDWKEVREADRYVNISQNTPSAIVIHEEWVYIAEHDNGRIIRVSIKDIEKMNGTRGNGTWARRQDIQIIANAAGRGGMSGDCGPATLATIRRPQGIIIIPARKGSDAMVAFTDAGNNRVRGFELTDWPGCVGAGVNCAGVTGAQIDMSTGNTTSTYSFETNSPDQCAFHCRQLSLATPTNYPFQIPWRNLNLTNTQLNKLLKGCESEAGSPDAFLLQCLPPSGTKGRTAAQNATLGAREAIPINLRSYSLIKYFPDGPVSKGEELLGAVVAGRLMRLNSTQLSPSNWGAGATASGGEFRFNNPKTVKCAFWYWQPNKPSNYINVTFVRPGKCHLYNSSNVNSSCAKSNSSTSGSMGTSMCRPGKMQTLIGGGPPGLPSQNSAIGQPYATNPLTMRLKKPSSLLLMNAGQHGELMRQDLPAMTLVVSDSHNQRIVSLPLTDHKKYHVRFWLFVQGPNAAQTAMKLAINRSTQAIAWAFGQSIGWEYTFEPVKLTDLNVMPPVVPTSKDADLLDRASCNPERLETNAEHTQHTEEINAAKAFGQQMCPTTICTASAPFGVAGGFSSVQCCRDFCKSTFDSCGLQIATWGAAVTSLQKCKALTQMKACLTNASTTLAPTGCPRLSALDVPKYIDAILGFQTGYVSSLQAGPCKGIMLSNSIGCSGKCDLKIHEVLQVNKTWFGSASTVALLYELSTFDYAAYQFFGKVLDEVKSQEQVVAKKFPYPITGPGPSGDLSHWGVGTRLYNFMHVFGYILQNCTTVCGLSTPIPLSDAKLSFSSTVRWTGSDLSSFMSEEKVPQGMAYWMAGQKTGTSTGYGTEFNHPTGLALDKAQRLYVSDSSNARIVRIQNLWLTNNFSNVAVGTGYATFNGNGDLADETSLTYPRGLAMDSTGTLLFADTKHHDIRQVLGISWNEPCTLSKTYYDKLSAPTPQEVDSATSSLNCRLIQVRANVVHQINLCRTCSIALDECRAVAATAKAVALAAGKTAPKHPDCESFPIVSSSPMFSAQSAQIAAQKDCSSSMFTSLCSVQPYKLTTQPIVTPTHTRLSELLKDIPDCGPCKKEHGCEFAEGSQVWNATLNDTEAGDDTPYELTRMLSDNAASMSLRAINKIYTTLLHTSNQKGWSGLLEKEMKSCVESKGHDALQNAIAALKTKLCSGTSDALYMARIYFYHWFNFISDVCVEVIDNPRVDKAAHLGAQYYDKMSNMVTGIYWHAFDAMTSTWTPSSACIPACDIMHPRFFLTDSWRDLPWRARESTRAGGNLARLPRLKGQCCGMQPANGYLCNVGEGPCQLNSDCATGLICGTKNCLWGKDENCCAATDNSNSYARMQDLSRTTGFPELAKLTNLWDQAR